MKSSIRGSGLLALLIFSGCYSATYDNVMIGTGGTQHYRTVCRNEGRKILCNSFTCADATLKACTQVASCEQRALIVPADKGTRFCPTASAQNPGGGVSASDGHQVYAQATFVLDGVDAKGFELDRSNIGKTTLIAGKRGHIECTFEGGSAAAQTPVVDGRTIRLPQPVETAICEGDVSTP